VISLSAMVFSSLTFCCSAQQSSSLCARASRPHSGRHRYREYVRESTVCAGQTLTEQRLGFLNFSAAAGIAPGVDSEPMIHADVCRARIHCLDIYICI